MGAGVIVRSDPQGVAGFRARHRLAFARAVDECVGEADRNAPRDMGILAASINPGPIVETATGLVGGFGSSQRYALMRELGGEIRPVRGRALSWRSKSGIRIVLGPGIKRTHMGTDSRTGEPVLFVARAFVRQRPGGPSNGYRPYLKPAGDRFPDFMGDHLRAVR